MINRMTQQHQKNITNSFFELLSFKPINEISIVNITNKAHISRRTFYRIFKNKDDVIDTYIQELLKEYAAWILELGPQTYDQIIDNFFDYWPKHSEKLKILVNADLSYKLLDNANQIFPSIFINFHQTNQNVSWHLDVTNKIEVAYLSRISVGIFWNTFTLWLKNPNSISLDKLTHIIKRDLHQIGNY